MTTKAKSLINSFGVSTDTLTVHSSTAIVAAEAAEQTADAIATITQMLALRMIRMRDTMIAYPCAHTDPCVIPTVSLYTGAARFRSSHSPGIRLVAADDGGTMGPTASLAVRPSSTRANGRGRPPCSLTRVVRASGRLPVTMIPPNEGARGTPEAKR